MSSKLNDLGLLWLRVLTGAGLMVHGYQKVFQGGVPGLAKMVASFGFPQPEVFAWAAALSEFAGGLFIILGLYTRLAALFAFITMSVAAFIALKAKPFETRELALAYWTLSGTLVFLGGGSISLSSKLGKGKAAAK
jgi:putative oxidoreductase